MKPAKSFTVSPNLPKKLERLRDLAFNLRWTWDDETRNLFSRMDMDLWEEVDHDPVAMLNKIDQDTLEQLANDDSYVYSLDKVLVDFDLYLESTPWFHKRDEYSEDLNIAYFSMEFGITESMAIYSGGLGVLSGDHIKSSSEIGIPLTGIGLAYQMGYFSQSFNIDGWQEEKYVFNDFYNWPMKIKTDDQGNPHIISVDFPGRKVYAQIWEASVGRISLYLLDTNIDKNSEEDKKITFELYGGDQEMRIKQEIMLGMGGIKLLNDLGKPNSVIHMNEGHSAFAGLEKIKTLMSDSDLSFYEALEVAKASAVFTTHTPVKAGIDLFSASLIKKYFEDYCKTVGISPNELLDMGKIDKNGDDSFSMAILAINMAYKTNGVSELHGKVSRKMWKSLWPSALEKEIPISSVTNGIHQPSWLSREMVELFNRYLGPAWREEPASSKTWNRVKEIPDGELWRVHQTRRTRLVEFARRSLAKHYRSLDLPEADIQKAESVLDTNALTIGFARRFATYKRGTLIFRDIERLKKIVTDEERPVQIILSGKAHPQDKEGKELIKKIFNLAKDEDLHNHIVFISDYNMNIARYLVEGCDIWLNTPRRPQEACGTSGMKAAANGALNFSTLDGWWDEAYNRDIGWSIGNREELEDYNSVEEWDHNEANDIYRLLEEQIIPAFYERGRDKMPRRWIKMMKNSMAEVCPIFNTNRMLKEYTLDYYVPAFTQSSKLKAEGSAEATRLAAWKENIATKWDKIRFINVDSSSIEDLTIDSDLKVTAEVYLADIPSNDVNVEIYYGKLNTRGELEDGNTERMEVEKELGDGKFLYTVNINSWASGLNGFTLRMIPNKDYLPEADRQKLIYWLGDEEN
ncbi:MAG: alpha-glucan family phosphorylase [Candidatus Marinimicrobia bacterium]|nr:alpha-glucan family phosphorylase [Candidatus Neomarinimicrobiota bacterium]